MPDLLSAPSKADLRAALARIEDLKAAGARVLYDLGLVLRDVEARELWRASDAPGFSAWLEGEAGLSRPSARRAIDEGLLPPPTGFQVPLPIPVPAVLAFLLVFSYTTHFDSTGPGRARREV